MDSRLLGGSLVLVLALVACGDAAAPTEPTGTGGVGGQPAAPGPGGSGGVPEMPGEGGTGGEPAVVGACGPPLSAPTPYDSEEALASLVVGAWLVCDADGLFTPEAIGIEVRADQTWSELYDVDGLVVRSEESRPWTFIVDERGTLTFALEANPSSFNLYRPKFYEREGQMQIEHIGDDLRLRSWPTNAVESP